MITNNAETSGVLAELGRQFEAQDLAAQIDKIFEDADYLFVPRLPLEPLQPIEPVLFTSLWDNKALPIGGL